MGAQTITLCEYQALSRRFTDVQVIETDGLLITRGFLPERGYLLAMQPCASNQVTIVEAAPTHMARAMKADWLTSWLGVFRPVARI